jgi:hypothetical protein
MPTPHIRITCPVVFVAASFLIIAVLPAFSAIVTNGLVANLDASDNPLAGSSQWKDLSGIPSNYDGSGFGAQARMHASNGTPTRIVDGNNQAFYTTLGSTAVFGPFGENNPPLHSEPDIRVENWTVELWLRRQGNSLADEHQVSALRTPGHTQRFSLGLAASSFPAFPANNLIVAEFRGAAGDAASAFDTGVHLPADGQFHHVVAAYNDAAGTLHFYFDTSVTDLSANVPANMNWNAMDHTWTSLFVTFRPEWSRRFNGDISIARIYDRALSAADVVQNFQVGPAFEESIPPVAGALIDLNAANNPRAGANEWENQGTAGGYLSVEPVGNPGTPAQGVDADSTAFFSTAPSRGGGGSLGRVDGTHNGSGRLGEPSLFLQDFTLEVWARRVGGPLGGEHQLWALRSVNHTQIFGWDLAGPSLDTMRLAMRDTAMSGVTVDTGYVMPVDTSFHQYIMTWDNAAHRVELIADTVPVFNATEPNVNFSPAVDMWMTSLFKSFAIEGDSRRFNGDISIFRVYDFLLDAGQIAQNFASGPARFSPLFRDETATRIPGLSTARVAWGDYNDDGYTDLAASGVVWRNVNGLTFENEGSFGLFGVWGDVDNNGFLDYFSWQDMAVYTNHNGVLSGAGPSAIPLPALTPGMPSLGACWGDFDGDTYADLYIGGYEDFDNNISYPDHHVRNQSGTSLAAVWSEPNPVRRGRGVTACDFDEDGDLDVYVSNYRLQPNLLWRNDGNGNFSNVAPAFGAAGNAHTIGSAWGDMDNDGHFDIFVGNFAHPGQPETQFLKNLGPGGSYHFTDMAATAQLAYQESYSSPALADYDNDGDLDFYLTVANDSGAPGGDQSPVLYRNEGNWQFTDVTGAAGLGDMASGEQAGWADFDNDGDLDLVTQGKLFVNKSQDNGNHWLKIKLDGRSRGVNAAAIGAQARIQVGSETLARQVEAGTGEFNMNDLVLHFGLGQEAGPVNVEIRWPGGTAESFTDIAVDQFVEIPFPLSPDITAASLAGGSSIVTLQWQSEANRTYRIEKAPEPGQTFIPLDTVNATSPLNTYSHTGITEPSAIYRIVVVP